jgi:hypothetical protein
MQVSYHFDSNNIWWKILKTVAWFSSDKLCICLHISSAHSEAAAQLRGVSKNYQGPFHCLNDYLGTFSAYWAKKALLQPLFTDGPQGKHVLVINPKALPLKIYHLHILAWNCIILESALCRCCCLSQHVLEKWSHLFLFFMWCKNWSIS